MAIGRRELSPFRWEQIFLESRFLSWDRYYIIKGKRGETMEPTREQQHTTCLIGAERAPKDHPVIAFRGGMDELSALAQLVAVKHPEGSTPAVCAGAVAQRCNDIFAAEYSGTPLDRSPYPLIEKPHAMSHDPMTYFGVSHFFGVQLADEPLCWLNLLRTKVRQVERLAVAAFGEERADLVEELNLMSSYVYCCMCRYRGETEARP
jgi:ethanolamine utilization cobalamin adenosyltransferase